MDLDTICNPMSWLNLAQYYQFAVGETGELRGTGRESRWTCALSAVSPSIFFIKSEDVELEESSVALSCTTLHTSYTHRPSIAFGHS